MPKELNKFSSFVEQAVTAVVDDKREMVLPFVHKNEPFA